MDSTVKALVFGRPWDFNGHGIVSRDDLDTVQANWDMGMSPAAATLPKPSTGLLLALGLLTLGLRARRRECR